MKHLSQHRKSIVTKLICEFEASLIKGTVAFQEETEFVEMIDLCEQNQKWPLAIHIVDAALTFHSYSVELIMRKAELLLNCNMIEESFVTITEAEKLAPYNISLRLLKAEVLAMKHQNDEALYILNTSKSYASLKERAEIYLLESHIFEYMKQYNEAFASIRRSLLADPTNSEAYQKALILTESKGFNAEAIELYNRLLDYDAYNWQAWMNLGYALSGLHKYEDAIEAFEFAFAINERCKEAYLEAGSLLVLKADYHRAIAVLENALFEAEDDALLMQQLGICYEKLKDYTTALSYYSRSHEIDPYDAETLFRMGRCAKAIGNWLQAIEAYENAIDIEDWREEYHAALGEAYEHLNQNSKAFYSYRKAATLARHDVFYWLQYTSFLMNIGQEKMALRALIQADKYVDDTAIEYMRIACLYEMGKKEEAIFRLREVLQSDFGNHIIMFRWRPYLRKSTELGAVIESFKN